ncbi:MAG TPA: transporter [Woeseiaceae bacterium]|nr:transporter [Woeseiaceae bacterium]
MVLCTLLPGLAFAQGGPPLITDDPGTPGDGQWEINTSMTLERTRSGRTFEAPLLDLNYGIGERLQLKYEVPLLVVDEEGQPRRSALGNSAVGVKWRFLDDAEHGLSLSIYPQLETNTPGRRAVERGLVDEGLQFLAPLEVAWQLGALELGAEVGYQLIEDADDEWKYGFAAGYAATPRLELLSEIAGFTDEDFSGGSPVFNVGLRYAGSELVTLLFSAGRALDVASEEDPELTLFAGVQWIL